MPLSNYIRCLIFGGSEYHCTPCHRRKSQRVHFLHFFHIYAQLTSDFIRLVLSHTQGSSEVFPLNAHISPVCIRLSADHRRIRAKYEHFPSNGKNLPPKSDRLIFLFYFFKRSFFLIKSIVSSTVVKARATVVSAAP